MWSTKKEDNINLHLDFKQAFNFYISFNDHRTRNRNQEWKIITLCSVWSTILFHQPQEEPPGCFMRCNKEVFLKGSPLRSFASANSSWVRPLQRHQQQHIFMTRSWDLQQPLPPTPSLHSDHTFLTTLHFRFLNEDDFPAIILMIHLDRQSLLTKWWFKLEVEDRFLWPSLQTLTTRLWDSKCSELNLRQCHNMVAQDFCFLTTPQGHHQESGWL